MDSQVTDFSEVPQLYKRHVFACHTQRPPTHPRGSCGAAGAQPLWERLGNRIGNDGLTDVGFTVSGCLGFCSAGPLMVVYPEGIWYRPTTPEDIDEIVETHLKNGELVERLVMVFARA
ncbi:(2Fe-2S) ferredoxin domain-containing protein [Roseibium marinum]|uniref:(2Fe-2S) ferredoxin n=1 Tax=Roseibium marinum TaxID=281252 RepID=A0A2S3V1J1_9HYPH|nr:(2Fe-2S) ferredoxin domain-containing protein [Roseibium marinum]POF33832.1 (2Fe-2S) ferredoxin [Roseibium marinum]